MKSFSYDLLSFAKVVFLSFTTHCRNIQVRRTDGYAVKFEAEVW